MMLLPFATLRFQSTRPRGARRHNRISRATRYRFQSTRPRGARPAPARISFPGYSVSIHAPARGATSTRRTVTPSSGFQSTRPRGARPRLVALMKAKERFNPRARAGRDHLSGDRGRLRPVSIHAPARGATLPPQRAPGSIQFQSTRPRGARPRTWVGFSVFGLFQSTRPRGARRSCASGPGCPGCFNPRARAGRDPTFPAPPHAGKCFNPRARAGRDEMRCGA